MKRWAIIALAASAMALLLVVLSLAGSPSKGHAQPPPDPHYKCYAISGDPVNIPVSVTTQFGTEPAVVAGTPSSLCLPAGKNGPIPPGWPDLKCYSITGQDAKLRVNLETQFGLERNVWVGQALELCVPASRTGTPPPATPHYECYNITGSAPSVPPVDLLTDFGLEPGVVVQQPVRVCLPAGVNSTTIPAVPHLKCYTIADPSPGETVNLTTVEFPPENGVEVGPATRLCLPAIKTFPGVGGIAEGPGLAGTSAGELGASDGGSGWSAGAYAALAAGLAALAVALSAGAWYARRRWVR
jgi:hypothetical protein